MRRTVCYSLLLPADGDRAAELLWQLEASVTTLRDHNPDIPVVVFWYGPGSGRVAPMAARLGIDVRDQGRYESRLAAALPRGWQVLRHYPVLHKFMNFATIARLGFERALLLDCDTLFSEDVDVLFHRYTDADVYAREEPTCRRSHHGYDPEYIDEDALAALAAAHGTSSPPPFNLGAVLFNNARFAELHALLPAFLSFVWQFTLWMAMNPPASEVERSFGEGLGVDELRLGWDELVTPQDMASALPFPSCNRWISEQVAAWLALGLLPAGSYGDFGSDVIQNGEFTDDSSHAPCWVLCHYFSQNTRKVFLRLNQAASCMP